MATVSNEGSASGGRARLTRLWPRSFRWRLQLWLALLLFCVLVAVIAVGTELQRVNRFRQIDAELEVRLASLSATVRGFYRDGPPPGERERRSGGPDRPRQSGPGGFREHRPPPDRPPNDFPPPRGNDPSGPPPRGRAERLRLPADIAGRFGAGAGYYFTIWYRDGLIVDRSNNVPADLPPPRRGERDTLEHFRTRGEAREAVLCSGLGDCVLAGKPLAADLAALRMFRWRLLAAGGIVFAVGLGIGWAITTRAIRPIEQISGAAVRIAGGDLSERVRIVDPDTEFGRLASVLNATFSRLEAAFARQVQFTGDAAHELRTPLAVLISETQTTLSRRRTSAEYRETLAGCLATAQQMRELTENLLALAKVDDVAESGTRGPVDLTTVAESVAGRLKHLAHDRQITIRCDLTPAIAFSVRERVDQMMSSLLANAIDYNHRGGQVCLSTHRENGSAVFTISDTGVGIGVEHLPHIFERFYRGDRSRSGSEGHVGLGLAICKAMVEAERGSISVTSAEGNGTTFTVRLPGQPFT